MMHDISIFWKKAELQGRMTAEYLFDVGSSESCMHYV
jgi:hypothetical protein